MKSEYLILNIVIVLGPLVSVLLMPNIQKPRVVPTLVALAIPALVFILWDIAVTGIFWYFNPSFILGPRIGRIPFEEVLFFFTVPFGCLVLWINWDTVHKSNKENPFVPIIVLFISVLVAVWSTFAGWYYTMAVCTVLTLTVVADYIFAINLFRKLRFQSYMLIVALLTFMFNLYLTARPIVLYNNAMKSNINVLTIPLEDFVYGIVLMYTVTAIYEYSRKNSIILT